MARVYKRKGDAAVNSLLSIPLTVATHQLLVQRAELAGKTKTEFARDILIAALTI